MYKMVNLNNEEQFCLLSEDEMTELVLKRVNRYVSDFVTYKDDIPVEISQCNITNALVIIRGRPATVDYHLLFPRTEVSYESEDQEKYAEKVMGDATMPWL